MKFLPIELDYNPETKRGSVTALEAVQAPGEEPEALGDTRIEFPLSNEAISAIQKVIEEDLERSLAAIRNCDS